MNLRPNFSKLINLFKSRPKIELTLLDQRALELVKLYENYSAPGTSGEWKRHNVLAELIDAFPTVRELELSKAIDRAVESLD